MDLNRQKGVLIVVEKRYDVEDITWLHGDTKFCSSIEKYSHNT